MVHRYEPPLMGSTLLVPSSVLLHVANNPEMIPWLLAILTVLILLSWCLLMNTQTILKTASLPALMPEVIVFYFLGTIAYFPFKDIYCAKRQGENVARGALLGALLGAQHGLSAFPEWTCTGLKHKNAILQEISALVALSEAGPKGSTLPDA